MIMSDAEKRQIFLDLYSEVFDEDDNIRVCTRKITSKLISFANKNFCDEGLAIFGSDYTGMMNTQELHALHKKLIEQNV